MKQQLRILFWSFIAYILSYIVFFAFVNESRASWSYWAFHGWSLGKCFLPLFVMVALTGSAYYAAPQDLPGRKLWIAWGLTTTPLVAFLSYDAWRMYSSMNDAPMGIVPDMNIVGCTLVAGFLLGCFCIGNLVVRWLRKNRHSA